ncbi:UNVERIFIED_CONTAM: hypothetical protein GTU68_000551 [Idotea baltica]|nr:hypothetical protein [Idotea baltica]
MGTSLYTSPIPKIVKLSVNVHMVPPS